MCFTEQSYIIFTKVFGTRQGLSLVKGRGRIRPQIGPLTFLKIFVLEMIYSGRSQHNEPSYAIFNTSLYYWS